MDICIYILRKKQISVIYVPAVTHLNAHIYIHIYTYICIYTDMRKSVTNVKRQSDVSMYI